MSRLFDDFPDLPPDDGPSITLYRDGPLIVRGNCRIVDADGSQIDPGRATVALCRCGRSALKPFCDGSHVATGFRASGSDDRDRPPNGDAQESAARARAQPLTAVAGTGPQTIRER
ncbi:MAG: CDGSH iron-sulfur domain-containing protein [Mycobacteriales bacterium]